MFKLLGDEGLHVITAVMSIIVLAMVAQFVINGVTEVISQIRPETIIGICVLLIYIDLNHSQGICGGNDK